MDNSTAALLQPPAEESQSSLVVLSVMGTRASHCRRCQSQLFVPFLNMFWTSAKYGAVNYRYLQTFNPDEARKGVAVWSSASLPWLASLSVLPVPRESEIENVWRPGGVLRVVRMRFLQCFLSRHCDV